MRPLTRKLVLTALAVLALVFTTRLLTVNRPLLGNFAGRQVPYAMAAEEYIKGAKLFYPQTFDLVNGKPTVMLLDFPLISVLAAGIHGVGSLPIDASGRLVSAAAAVLTAVILVLLAKKLWGFHAAIAAASLYSVSPLAILYGQSFQADALSAMFGIFALYAIVKAGDRKLEKFWMMSAGLAYGIAVVTRIHAGVLLLPATVLFLKRDGWKGLFSLNFFIFAITGALVSVPWYVHTFYAATHLDNVIWSNFHQSEVHGFPHPLLFQPEFYVQLAKLLTAYLWTPLGFFLLVPALIEGWRKKEWFSLSWFFAALLPVILLPRKVFDHNYYLIPAVVPGICLMASFLNAWLQKQKFSKLAAIYFICLAFGLAIAWRPLWNVPLEEQNIPPAAAKVRELTPENAKILFHGGPAFTYYSNRYGWSFDVKRTKLSIWLEENVGNFKSKDEMEAMKAAAQAPETWLEYLKKHEGAAYFASSNGRELRLQTIFYQYLTSNYKPIYQDENTSIFAL